ncbi:MAG: IS66 family transposase [Acetobacteraceae bacterium]|nr:IS66 family transposase [Acetobacteraceae bacterium]
MNPNRESHAALSREELVALVAAQATEIARQAVEIARQAAEIAALKAQFAELERRLALNSTNSGKPPSSDGLQKPPRQQRTHSMREVSGRGSGGQKGHKGWTLEQVAVPDRIVDHFPSSCTACGAAVAPAMSRGHSARQVFDLPEPSPLLVTEHRAHDCVCERCGAHNRVTFPDGVNAPVQYGPTITAFVLYLQHYQLLPEDRLAELMADLFGVKLAAATIARISRTGAARLQEVVAAVRDLVTAAAVKHLDETGFRIAGATQWLHVACTALLTFYRVAAKRGSLLANVTGIVVHDHWKPYYTMTNVSHALCNAHHLRELRALIDFDKEEWARKMQVLLRRAAHAVNLARQREGGGKPRVLTWRLIARFERRYDAIVTEGLAFHEAQAPLQFGAGAPPVAERKGRKRGRKPRRTGHNLLLRLAGRKADVLRFLNDPRVPFTNNQAERDLRMMKVKQKISGGFRSLQGAMDFAVIRSFISTAKKQGWNVIQALTEDPEVMAKALRTT